MFLLSVKSLKSDRQKYTLRIYAIFFKVTADVDKIKKEINDEPILRVSNA